MEDQKNIFNEARCEFEQVIDNVEKEYKELREKSLKFNDQYIRLTAENMVLNIEISILLAVCAFWFVFK